MNTPLHDQGNTDASDSAANRKRIIGIMILDKTGLIRNSNRQAASIFGGSPDRLIGRSIASLVPNIPYIENSPVFNARSLARICEASGWREFQGVDSQGRTFKLEIDLLPMQSDDATDPSISYFVKLARDEGGRT